VHETDGLTLDDLIADAVLMQLPTPRTPRVVIDLTVPAPRTIEIPDTTVSLVAGYDDYGT
jgi:hypothetical protein